MHKIVSLQTWLSWRNIAISSFQHHKVGCYAKKTRSMIVLGALQNCNKCQDCKDLSYVMTYLSTNIEHFSNLGSSIWFYNCIERMQHTVFWHQNANKDPLVLVPSPECFSNTNSILSVANCAAKKKNMDKNLYRSVFQTQTLL